MDIGQYSSPPPKHTFLDRHKNAVTRSRQRRHCDRLSQYPARPNNEAELAENLYRSTSDLKRDTVLSKSTMRNSRPGSRGIRIDAERVVRRSERASAERRNILLEYNRAATESALCESSLRPHTSPHLRRPRAKKFHDLSPNDRFVSVQAPRGLRLCTNRGSSHPMHDKPFC